MANLDPEQLLALLRDPNVESQEIAVRAGVAREEAGRAARLLMVLAKAKPEEVATLPGPLALALVRAAFALPRIELLTALAGHAEKDVVKEAKRCLHVLRTRGVAVPELARPAAPAPPPPPAEAPLLAMASTVDGHGERVVWHPRALPGRGIEVAQAVLSDERGLLSLQVGVVGRKEWRAYARGILERGQSFGVVEIPRERAHALVAEARQANERTGQRVPDGCDLWLNQLGPAPAVPAPAPLPPLDEAAEAAALAASGSLHERPLFKGWVAEEDYLRRLAGKLDEVQVSPLYIDEQQRSAQLDRVIADAVEEYLDASRREKLARRLALAAEHLTQAGDAAAAGQAAAVARALTAGKPGATIPFVRGLVEKAFPRRGPAPQAPQEGAGTSPLIVAPR
jgi:hypothetical protein